MKEKKCTSCRFAKEEFSSPGARNYSCRRHAPLPRWRGEPINKAMGGGLMAMWPDVMPDDWCGEFEEIKS